MNKVIKNEYGYYELAEKPTEASLNQYYAEQYYQEDKALYSKQYTADEKLLINNKIKRCYTVISSLTGCCGGGKLST
jgi:hypothetical protein